MPIILLQLIFFPHLFIIFPNNFPLVRLLTIFRFTVGTYSIESEMFREAHDFSFLLNAERKCGFFCTCEISSMWTDYLINNRQSSHFVFFLLLFACFKHLHFWKKLFQFFHFFLSTIRCNEYLRYFENVILLLLLQ